MKEDEDLSSLGEEFEFEGTQVQGDSTAAKDRRRKWLQRNKSHSVTEHSSLIARIEDTDDLSKQLKLVLQGLASKILVLWHAWFL